MAIIKQIQLKDKTNIPSLGLGTWMLEDKDVLINALEDAYSLGYRHIDTAHIYKNEHFIGEFLKKHNRNEFYITSKLWNADHDDVFGAIDRTLKDLGTDHVDLYLVHWPVNLKGPFDPVKVWKDMEKVCSSGKAKSIGVANFGIKNLTKILKECKIKPAVLQIELHPYLQQKELRKFCKEHGIQVQSYSPLGSTLGGKKILVEDPILKGIAKKQNCSVQSVILNFLLDEGLVVIPRSKSKSHLESNLKEVKLTEDEKNEIRNIKEEYRYVQCEEFGKHRFD